MPYHCTTYSVVIVLHSYLTYYIYLKKKKNYYIYPQTIFTLTLAFYMERMMADQVTVRKLSTCKAMGSATTICNDKTSTLTLNQMKVTKFRLGKVSYAANAIASRFAVYILLVFSFVSLSHLPFSSLFYFK